jgi:hypothetical protein
MQIAGKAAAAAPTTGRPVQWRLNMSHAPTPPAWPFLLILPPKSDIGGGALLHSNPSGLYGCAPGLWVRRVQN